MAELVTLADSIAKLGAIGLLALEVVLLVVGILRVGKLVDSERERATAAADKRVADIIIDRDKREATIVAQYEKRIGEVIDERDTWQNRSTSTDERLERLSAAFERITRQAAPP